MVTPHWMRLGPQLQLQWQIFSFTDNQLFLWRNLRVQGWGSGYTIITLLLMKLPLRQDGPWCWTWLMRRSFYSTTIKITIMVDFFLRAIIAHFWPLRLLRTIPALQKCHNSKPQRERVRISDLPRKSLVPSVSSAALDPGAHLPNSLKRGMIEWEKIFANDVSIRG